MQNVSVSDSVCGAAPVSRRAGRVWWDGEQRQVGGGSVTPVVTRWQEPSPGPAPRRRPHLVPPTCRRTLGSICSNLLCVDNSEWWMATLLTKLTLFGLLSSLFVKIEQEIHWNVTGLVRMRKFWVNSPSQFFLYFSLWDLCTRKFISVKKPIQYFPCTIQIDARIWMLKILSDCIYVFPPINPKMMDNLDMDNFKLNSTIYVYCFVYSFAVKLWKRKRKRKKGRIKDMLSKQSWCRPREGKILLSGFFHCEIFL